MGGKLLEIKDLHIHYVLEETVTLTVLIFARKGRALVL